MLADFPITVLCAQVVVHTEHRAADGLLWLMITLPKGSRGHRDILLRCARL